jgi:hypothetical protein
MTRALPAVGADLAKTFARIRRQRLAPLATGASVPVWRPKVSG